MSRRQHAENRIRSALMLCGYEVLSVEWSRLAMVPFVECTTYIRRNGTTYQGWHYALTAGRVADQYENVYRERADR